MRDKLALAPHNYFTPRDSESDWLIGQRRSVIDLILDVSEFVPYLALRQGAIERSDFPGAYVGPDVFVGEGVTIEPSSYIAGPTYLAPGTVVRHGAYIRGGVIALSGSTIGHATEIKNSILLSNAAAPHFAYVGDSIIGSGANLGAGAKLSNLPILRDGQAKGLILEIGDERIDTGLRKLGAIVGDDAQVGCNAVLAPGVFLGPGSVVYATALVPRGFYPRNSLLKAPALREVTDLR